MVKINAMENSKIKSFWFGLLFFVAAAAAMGQDVTIRVGTANRVAMVYAPANLPANRPLLISLHGMDQDAEYQRNQTAWNAKADAEKFLVVYPRAINLRWDISGNSDINFILAIIDQMHASYSIDKNRVYVSGFSMGGMMSYHAANNIADKIAAIAPVGGYLFANPVSNSRPMPLIHIHGTTDNVIAFSGVAAILDKWRTSNGCTSASLTTNPYPANRTNSQDYRQDWNTCNGGSAVTLISLHGKGHWHSNEPNGVHSTNEIWNFVSKYSLQPAPAGPSVKLNMERSYAAPANISIASDFSHADPNKSVVNIKYFNGNQQIVDKWVNPFVHNWENVAAGTYTIIAVAYDADGKSASDTMIVKVNPPQAPYGGAPHPVPGKIELEHFDIGGNGFAYFDKDAGSRVNPRPNFRTDEDVDIEVCTDTGGGYNIGWTFAGEWLEYTVNVAHSGNYDITFRAAVDGANRTISLSANGETVASNIAIPNTGGWQAWQDVTVRNLPLNAGEQILRLTIGGVDYVNLNYMVLLPAKKQAILLKKGWNIIGCPLPGSTSIEVALSSIWSKLEAAKDGNSFYLAGKAAYLNSLVKLEWAQGYFVNVSEDCLLEW
jgi:poly(3-hydroxybutyrate) depolymerase